MNDKELIERVVKICQQTNSIAKETYDMLDTINEKNIRELILPMLDQNQKEIKTIKAELHEVKNLLEKILEK